jgi:hypothetical protein
MVCLVNVWYHGEYIRITVIRRYFAEATKCIFWKITMNHCDSDLLTMISNIPLVFLENNRNTHLVAAITMCFNFFLGSEVSELNTCKVQNISVLRIWILYNCITVQ